MEVDNKTIIIIGVVLIGFGALWINYNDLALAVVSGLVGYLSKDAVDYTDNSTRENQTNEFNNKSQNTLEGFKK